MEFIFLVKSETGLYFQIVLLIKTEEIKLVFIFALCAFRFDLSNRFGLERFEDEFETLVLLK